MRTKEEITAAMDKIRTAQGELKSQMENLSESLKRLEAEYAEHYQVGGRFVEKRWNNTAWYFRIISIRRDVFSRVDAFKIVRIRKDGKAGAMKMVSPAFLRKYKYLDPE